MTNKVIDVSNRNIDVERVLVDTNVWIYVEWNNNPNSRTSQAYSNALSRFAKQGIELVTNDYVLGELANKCSKFEYDRLSKITTSLPKYKLYRQSDAYRDVMQNVTDTCIRILDLCEYLPIYASKVECIEHVNSSTSGKMDFSDLVLSGFCRKQKIAILTHDADFSGCGATLITANRALLP